MPLVSVVMPVYNTEQYVGPAIESILSQTFEDVEFVTKKIDTTGWSKPGLVSIKTLHTWQK